MLIGGASGASCSPLSPPRSLVWHYMSSSPHPLLCIHLLAAGWVLVFYRGRWWWPVVGLRVEGPCSAAHQGLIGSTYRGAGAEDGCAAAAVSLVLFVVIRLCILRRENSLKHGFRALPFFYGLTVAFLAYFFVYKASPGLGMYGRSPFLPPQARASGRFPPPPSPFSSQPWGGAGVVSLRGPWGGAGWDKQYTPTVILGVCGAIGFGTLFVVWLLGVPLLWQWIDNKYDEQGELRKHYYNNNNNNKSTCETQTLPPPPDRTDTSERSVIGRRVHVVICRRKANEL